MTGQVDGYWIHNRHRVRTFRVEELRLLAGGWGGVGAEESKGQFQYQIRKIPVSTTRHHRVRKFRVDLVGGPIGEAINLRLGFQSIHEAR